MKSFIIFVFAVILWGCKSDQNSAKLFKKDTYPDVNIVSAMKNVMWRGELEGKIDLDTISKKNGLYGLGPLSGLKGELLIKDGVSYISKFKPERNIQVEKTFKAKAPFFVYTYVSEWQSFPLNDSIKTISDLEIFINKKTIDKKRPFAFKLNGTVKTAHIHIQNLPEGAQVSSPKDAHQGQLNFVINDENVDIVGFFSTEHQGVFTHHDSFLHMHLITSDETQMGHLDKVEFDKMTVFLPVK